MTRLEQITKWLGDSESLNIELPTMYKVYQDGYDGKPYLGYIVQTDYDKFILAVVDFYNLHRLNRWNNRTVTHKAVNEDNLLSLINLMEQEFGVIMVEVTK